MWSCVATTKKWAQELFIQQLRFMLWGLTTSGGAPMFSRLAVRPMGGMEKIRIASNAYYQFQVLLKPAPEDSRELYEASLAHLGLDKRRHDFQYAEDDWESPTLGATGLGWEVRCDGLEITQFTYFQQMGGIECNPPSVELTYGLERIASILQDRDSVYDLAWNNEFSYGEVHRQVEIDFSKYNFEQANPRSLTPRL